MQNLTLERKTNIPVKSSKIWQNKNLKPLLAIDQKMAVVNQDLKETNGVKLIDPKFDAALTKYADQYVEGTGIKLAT